MTARAIEPAYTRGKRVLMVDNYDSFTYNLVHLLEELGAHVDVRRSDEIGAGDPEKLAPDRLVISPGPGRPAGEGSSSELIRCLGRGLIEDFLQSPTSPARP